MQSGSLTSVIGLTLLISSPIWGATFRTSAAGGGTSGTGDRTVTIVPAVNDLFVVFCVVSGNTNTAPTMTDDNGAGAYTRITTAFRNASVDIMSAFVRNSLVPNTTSTVITCATGSNTAGNVVAVAVSGMSRTGSSAIKQNARQENQAASTTPAPAFAASALTANMTLGAIGNNSNPAGMTAPTSWTAQQDVGQNAPATGLNVVTRDSGFTGTTITWGSTSPSVFGSIIVELDNTAAAVATAVCGPQIILTGAGCR